MPLLPASDRADNQERFGTRRDRRRKRSIGRLVRKILFTGKEANERPAPVSDVIANRASQHGEADFERIENRRDRDFAWDGKL